MRKTTRNVRSAWQPGWTTAAADNRFAAETIVGILRAGKSGSELAALCASEGIPLDTYYVWKLRYTGLTVDEIRDRRSQEAQAKRRGAVGWAARFAALAVGMILVTKAIASVAKESTLPRPETLHSTSRASAAITPNNDVDAAGAVGAPTRPVTAPDTDSGSTRVAESAQPDAASVTLRQSYQLQVMASPDRNEAEAWVDRLTEAGYVARLSTVQIDHTQMYRVRVGPIPKREEAEEIGRHLEQEGYPPPWLVQ